MEQVQVKVEAIAQRSTTNGGKAYSVKADDGNWYGLGFDSPQFLKGDTITFQWSNNARGYKTIAKGTVKKVGSAPQSAASDTTNAKPRSYMGDDKRQDSIIYQSSLERAIMTAGLLLKHSAFPLPTKKGESYGAVMGLIDELTQRYALAAKTAKIEEKNPSKEQDPEDTIPF